MKTGVLLLQMGGPRNLEEVEGYIEALFRDPDLVRLPHLMSWFRGPLARRVARKRAPVVREQYQTIGGSSPNNATTIRQAELLEELLGESHRCFAAMAYTPPSVFDAVEQAVAEGCETLVALTMFPQYSTATTAAVMKDVEASCRKLDVPLSRVRKVERWASRPDFLDAWAKRIVSELAEARRAGPGDPVLVASAHGLPVSYIESGDPYLREMVTMMAGLKERLPEGLKIELAFQSRVTREPWLEPSTEQTLKRLPADGFRNLVLLAPSFVHDHIETLFEIDQELAEVARIAGAERVVRVPAFNADPELIQILAKIVREHT